MSIDDGHLGFDVNMIEDYRRNILIVWQLITKCGFWKENMFFFTISSHQNVWLFLLPWYIFDRHQNIVVFRLDNQHLRYLYAVPNVIKSKRVQWYW